MQIEANNLKFQHPTSFGKNLKTTKVLYKLTKCAHKEKYLWRYLRSSPKLGLGELHIKDSSLHTLNAVT